MTERRVDKRLLAPVLMGFFIMGFCDIVAPVTNIISGEFAESQQSAVSFLPSMVFLWFLLLSTPVAALMNRIGRKRTAMIGYAFTIAGLLVPYAAGVGSALSWYFIGFGLLAIGPAGSGKTYTAIALAVRALKEKHVKRIILTRPAVEAGEKLGFLPGDMKEKLDPYLQPLYDALNDMIPPAKLQKYIEEGTVQIAPLAYMRGRTLDNAFVILDEAQNTTLPQIKMFLTRMGRNAKFIVTGDVTQIDLPRRSDSGLTRAMEILRGVEGIGIVEFDRRDIVRHPLVKQIVEAFDRSAAVEAAPAPENGK